MDNLIEVTNITKRYQGFTLDNVCLSVPAGCIVGLVGENGAGKTTLLRAILGMLRPDSGEVTLMGSKPDILQARERVAAVFEDNFFYGGLNASQVGKVMKNTVSNWNSDLFSHYLRSFGLETIKPIRQYSKGMKMKLNLATALARDPQLLILDEPTSGLDPVARGELLDILMSFMQNEQNAILISTHLTADLEKIADQIAYIHAGKLVFQRDKIDLMEDMGVLKCSAEKIDALPNEWIIAQKSTMFGDAALVRHPDEVRRLLPNAIIDTASIDDMMRFYSGRDDK